MVTGPPRTILRLLDEQGQLPVTAIAEELDRHPVTVDRQCYDLQRDGHIRMATSGGAYALTEEGRKRLSESSNSADPVQ